ncbi:unnamed protein product [Nezara viridula]|uniref:Uncharacterized protein n=1 Tax=Nezara viridula TaxID=85310 RepID=A0A9P0H3N2_NEZVI|nr:unnamed protein product [Nezara viridula]
MGEEEGKEEERAQAIVEGNLEEVPSDNLLQKEESLARKCPIEKAEIIQDLLRDYLELTNIIVEIEAVAHFVEHNRTDERTTQVRTSRDVFTKDSTPLVEMRTTGVVVATPVSMGRKMEVPTNRGITVEEPMRDEETHVLAGVPVSQKKDSTNTFITLKGATEGWTMVDIHKQLPTEEELKEIGVSAKVVRPLSDGKGVLVRTEGLVQANKILEWDRLKEQGLEARLTTSRRPRLEVKGVPRHWDAGLLEEFLWKKSGCQLVTGSDSDARTAVAPPRSLVFTLERYTLPEAAGMAAYLH